MDSYAGLIDPLRGRISALVSWTNTPRGAIATLLWRNLSPQGSLLQDLITDRGLFVLAIPHTQAHGGVIHGIAEAGLSTATRISRETGSQPPCSKHHRKEEEEEEETASQ